MDGILGLAFPRISLDNSLTVMQNAWNQQALDENIFAFLMTLEGGHIDFGGLDPTYMVTEPTYFPVTLAAYWETRFDGMTGPWGTVGSNGRVILDTGTSIIVGPTDLIQTVIESYPVDAQCHSLAWLEPVTFGIYGQDFTLSADQLVVQEQITPTQTQCMAPFEGMDL
ncbi:aspartic peptidase, partial [Kipferlia bialata]|eukprot:g5688.t1